MEEEPFRVLLDFSEVITGISGLKYVWMLVSPRELNTIYDFKQAIIKKFSFDQEGFKLFVRDGLLLETEKIAILREDDIVKVQFEASCETSVEVNAANPGINISVARASCNSLISNSVGQSKSCKRKSETFITASAETKIDCLSTSRSKKKKKLDKTTCTADESTGFSRTNEPSISLSGSRKEKKQDKTACISDESTSFSRIDEPSINISPDLSSMNKKVKFDALCNKDKNNKHSGKSKKKLYPKTPTREFINFAVKLSEPERMSQDVHQTDVTVTNSTRVRDNVTDTNLYKTAEIVSKTNLSPILEHTYELSNNNTPLNATEVFDVRDCQIDAQTPVIEEVGDVKNSRKRKRRRRKRKVIASTDDLGPTEESFLADVKSDETYSASSDTRKHIIFHSPTPPKIGTTVTLVSTPESSYNQPEELSIENSSLQSIAELDASKNKFLKEGSQLDAKVVKESIISETEDYNKESTPFLKKKSKGKSWGVTPLPRIGSSSHTFSMENSDISGMDVTKTAYQDCTPLNCLPPLGTRLAYKTLELNEEYCPEITEYKEGILRKVDPNTDELEIELIHEEIKPGRSGKFENLWKDEPIPDDQVIKTVSLNWSALIDPILIPQ